MTDVLSNLISPISDLTFSGDLKVLILPQKNCHGQTNPKSCQTGQLLVNYQKLDNKLSLISLKVKDILQTKIKNNDCSKLLSLHTKNSIYGCTLSLFVNIKSLFLLESQ